jgi:hypothetical protein
LRASVGLGDNVRHVEPPSSSITHYTRVNDGGGADVADGELNVRLKSDVFARSSWGAAIDKGGD